MGYYPFNAHVVHYYISYFIVLSIALAKFCVLFFSAAGIGLPAVFFYADLPFKDCFDSAFRVYS
jgi:hypothetical protein